MLPSLRIQILETLIDLKKVRLLTQTPADKTRYRDGILGMNALWSGFLLDFDAMRLEVR